MSAQLFKTALVIKKRSGQVLAFDADGYSATARCAVFASITGIDIIDLTWQPINSFSQDKSGFSSFWMTRAYNLR